MSLNAIRIQTHFVTFYHLRVQVDYHFDWIKKVVSHNRSRNLTFSPVVSVSDVTTLRICLQAVEGPSPICRPFRELSLYYRFT